MNHPIVQSSEGVTLVAGGPVASRELSRAIARAPLVVAADGGADRALAAGVTPSFVIGDFDSISAAARETLGPDRLFHVPEQDSTDFDKALRHIDAPFVLAVGAMGDRVDHGLAVFNALVRHTDRVCVLIGPEDVVFAAPPELRIPMTEGDRLSLFPMRPISGESIGLRWPIGGLAMAPASTISTSNEVTGPEVWLRFDRPGMLVIAPSERLDAVLTALEPQWSATARRPAPCV